MHTTRRETRHNSQVRTVYNYIFHIVLIFFKYFYFLIFFSYRFNFFEVVTKIFRKEKMERKHYSTQKKYYGTLLELQFILQLL